MTAAPRWFKPVVIAALLWNVLGCFAYLSDVMLTAADIAKMTPDQQALHNSRPIWAVAAYALAVWGGLLGSIALLLKKRWATPVFAVSLAGVIVQDTALFLFTNATTKVGAPVYLLQALVIIVCVLLVWLSRKAAAAGWTG
jgi:ABC-type xylose transport system permease subunit